MLWQQAAFQCPLKVFSFSNILTSLGLLNIARCSFRNTLASKAWGALVNSLLKSLHLSLGSIAHLAALVMVLDGNV